MGSVMLQHLPSAWHVDQAILSEERRIVCLRFGNDANPECMRMDEMLYKIVDQVKEWAVIYLVDNKVVTFPCPYTYIHTNTFTYVLHHTIVFVAILPYRFALQARAFSTDSQR